MFRSSPVAPVDGWLGDDPFVKSRPRASRKVIGMCLYGALFAVGFSVR
jgi:hypothetical protein